MPWRSRAQCHRSRQRVGTGQFQLEDPAAVHAQRRTAVEQQRRGDVAAAGQQFAEDARLDRLAGRQVDVVADVLLDVQIGAVFEAVLHRAMGVLLEPFPQIGGHRTRIGRCGCVCARSRTATWSAHEALRPRVPLGIGDPWPVLRSDVEVVVLRPARRRQVGVAHAAVAADGHGVRPRKSLLRCGPRHPAEAAAQLVGQSLRHRCMPTAACPAADRRSAVAPVRASATARSSISSASMSPGATSRSGSTRRISGISPGQLDAIHPSATPASTSVSARSSRADSSLSRYSTRRSFDGEHWSATPHVRVRRVQSCAIDGG